MINGHGGNIYAAAGRLGCRPEQIIDMSNNVNPLGPPPGLINFLKEQIQTITALPQVDAKDAIDSFSKWHAVDPEQVIAGNGSTQLIYTLPQALQTRKALILGPTYADYADACGMHHIDYEYLLARESHAFLPDLPKLKSQLQGVDTVFICNPNNPTGTLIDASELTGLCESFPTTFFIIDESYMPFVDKPTTASMLHCGLPNVIVLNSMSKIFRISGLRIGFMIASPQIVARMSRYRLPWNVNSLAQAAVVYLNEHHEAMQLFLQKTRRQARTEKKLLCQRLQDYANIKIFPSHTIFVLAKLCEDLAAGDVFQAMLLHRILLRNCANFVGLTHRFLRISLKAHEVNKYFAEKLGLFLSKSEASGKHRDAADLKAFNGHF